ncbi:hypothetical protein [Streptomyces sp. NRRL S-455]|uniref:hypothetical protein n=1 Tax=Streptomyces sp. NRRL S-455 TaxID=1463908 RepID=UPI0004BEF1CB|nr:hypothetical protein [Streptomyces sp. NRRL S-455]
MTGEPGGARPRRLCQNLAWLTHHLPRFVVDARHLAGAPASTARVGQRLIVTGEICRQALDDATAPREGLVTLTP